MSYQKAWTDFTYLFKSRKVNKESAITYTNPDPVTYARRKKLEEFHEARELERGLREVWD